MITQVRILGAMIALLVAGGASAASTWTLSTGTVTGSATAVTETSTGWANTGAGGTVNAQQLEGQPAGSNLALYSGGLGINNLDGCTSGTGCDVGDMASTAPEHALDNNERYEMVLLSFSQSVNLATVTTGWTGTDTDITVMAYTGSGTPATLSGQTWGTLASGWTVIGNYANAFATSSTAVQSKTITNSTYSSYWLIGAFNPLVPGGGTAPDSGSDYFKLYSVAGTVCGTTGAPSCTPSNDNKVPEPGSLALIGAALLGAIGLRRRAQA